MTAFAIPERQSHNKGNRKSPKQVLSIIASCDDSSVKPIETKITLPGQPLTQKTLKDIGKILKVLAWLDPKEIKDLVYGLKSDSTSMDEKDNLHPLAAKLGADRISSEENYSLEKTALFNFFKWRQELLQDSLSAPEVAALLNTSRQTPHDRLKKNTLIAVQDEGKWKFPKWQFDHLGPDGVIDGLPDVLKTLNVPALSKISWLTKTNQELGGITPIAALQKGEKDRVVAEAKCVGII
ncbi:helix-turn-helix domain-containing protein [Mastigocoleus sp. MO_188.B34]|uniref:helix-turn-helix domain-containing protein n=1 Tax=Mastigocoleus sp. MO_188.B34 TaxID=3036635 RepID=UPI002603D458|nr:helix-turn-helix domain-containing protein [Mastigocoleus sp. MO_188.B34]MDJ0693812.1 helix-turn-helix domain-containing protein [Mastigocoleus sp. MO_188.B34]